MKVAYICDLKQECNVSCGCCMNGGPCQHTFDISHAKNFEETPIIIGNGLFEEIPSARDGEAHYWEKPL